MAEPIIVSGAKKADNRRVKVIGALGAGLFLLVGVVPRVLGGGGGGDGEVTEFPTVAASPATTVAPEGAVTETFEGFTSKNPFTPLVATGPAPASSGGEVMPVVDPVDFVQPPATIPGEIVDPGALPPVDQGAPPVTAPPRQPDRVGMLEVYTDLAGNPVASVRVNDTTYQVRRGEEFAVSYQVISIDVSSRCGDFLFGDDRFRLCEGDEVHK